MLTTESSEVVIAELMYTRDAIKAAIGVTPKYMRPPYGDYDDRIGDISTQLGIPTSTVNDTIKRYKETGSAIPKKRPGRPKMLTQRDTRVLQRIIRTDRFSPIGDITNKLNSRLETTLHHNTVRKYLHNEDISSYTARKKPRLTEKHKKNRLKWCKEKKTGMMNGSGLYGLMSLGLLSLNQMVE